MKVCRSLESCLAHDYAADIVKGVIHSGARGAGSVLVVGAALYFGIDIPSLLPWRHPQLETGSIKAPAALPANDEAKKREIECNVAKAREVDALIERRKSSFSAYTKCLTEWQPGWYEKQTAEQACAPKLAQHQQIGQQVREKEAKDCAGPATK
jgi:hypothetical protein